MPESAPPIPQALAELQAWPHWVVWRIEQRPDGPTKVPYQAARPSMTAKSTVPSTWGTYEQAREAVERGRCEGIGYVFAPDDEYVGIDFDKCIQPPETAFAAALGQAIHPTVAEIVKRLDSYTEISPSGTGLHVYVRAQFPEGGRNNTGKIPTPWGGNFECYEKGRFFTVSGDHLPGTPETINARTDEFVALHARMFPAESPRANGKAPLLAVPEQTLGDVEIEERIRASKQAADFDRLMRGDTSGHSDDDSSADLALCNILAFWFGPSSARVDSMFRRSGLMREKWDAKRGEQTYGEMTIAKALEGRSEFYSQRKPGGRSSRREGRAEADEQARTELAEILGIKALALNVTKVVASGRDTKARYDIHISDGSVLTLDPISAYTTAPKLGAEVAIQLGAFPKLKDDKDRSRMLEVLRLIHTVREIREELTLDQRACDFGISFLQEVPTREVDWDNKVDKWDAFDELKYDPALLAQVEKTTVAAQMKVLVDKHGRRYVRVSWFSLYVKSVSTPGAADDACRRMLSQGWTKAGSEGRIKVTSPAGGTSLQWAFFIVEPDWEEQ